MAGKPGMYQPGNNKKGLDEHKLHGTYRNDRHGKKKVSEELQVKVTPDVFFSGSQDMTDEQLFDHLATYLHGHGMTAAVDTFMLSQWAQLIKAQREVKEILDTQGVTAKIGNKLAVNVFQEISKDIRVILSEYHLTPNTRNRSPETPKEEAKEDAVDEFLRTMQ